MESLEWIVAAVVVLALVLEHNFPFRGETAGEVRGRWNTREADGAVLLVKRLRPRRGALPRIRIIVSDQDSCATITMDGKDAKLLATLVERAADRVGDVPAVAIGQVGRVAIALARSGALGFVKLSFPGIDGANRIFLGAREAWDMVEVLRMAAQPGSNLKAAQQNWWKNAPLPGLE